MGISLDKLLSYKGNKYVFSRAAMKAIEKMGNIKDLEEYEKDDEKVVIKTLNYILNEKIKFQYNNENE